MLTEVKSVLITTDTGTKEVPIRDDSTRHLMKNRLAHLLREHRDVSADKKLGTELLAQAKDLFATYVAMQEVNRTTESEIRHVHNKIKQNEDFYMAMFGQLPDGYFEVVNLE